MIFLHFTTHDRLRGGHQRRGGVTRATHLSTRATHWTTHNQWLCTHYNYAGARGGATRNDTSDTLVQMRELEGRKGHSLTFATHLQEKAGAGGTSQCIVSDVSA